MISSFRGKYRFLSNFYECPIEFDGMKYQNAESAFQAMKTLNKEERKPFENMKPLTAKKKGKTIPLRDGWDDMREQIMYEVCKAKFMQNQDILEKLLQTGDEELVEGNHWGDTFWGACKGEGENKLGKILMRIRKEEREKA